LSFKPVNLDLLMSSATQRRALYRKFPAYRAVNLHQ
jgi:hypothetical protein